MAVRELATIESVSIDDDHFDDDHCSAFVSCKLKAGGQSFGYTEVSAPLLEALEAYVEIRGEKN